MNWYLAKIIYEITCGKDVLHPQFDEQLRLIGALSLQQAISKAEATGKREAHAFINEKEHLVEWKFICVTELHPLSDWIDGAEMFSKIHEPDDACAYLEAIHKKSESLHSDPSYKLAVVKE